LTRDTIRDSTNSGSRITLTGSAYVYGNVGSEDLEINQTGGIVQVELHNETLSGSGIFDVSSISQDYDHLILYSRLRSSVAATLDLPLLFLNNDTTTSNYATMGYYWGTGVGALSTACTIGPCEGATSTAGDFSPYEGIILNYADTTYNGEIKFTSNNRRDANNMYEQHIRTNWESTAAITRLTIQPDGYATDKFVAGSWLQIIGVKTVT